MKKRAKRTKTKRVAWWITPKRKLTKREKAARARARRRAFAKRLAKRKRVKKTWINRAVQHLGVSHERAHRIWDGKERITDEQALSLLQLRYR